MNIIINSFIIIIIVCVAIYTTSYGLWTWRKKNKLGAFMIFTVALAVILFPLYLMYFRFG